MTDPILLLALAGAVSFLAGYLRMITDDRGNVPLLEYRMTGCLGALVVGMMTGTLDLLGRRRSREAISALMVWAGIAAFAFLFGRGA